MKLIAHDVSPSPDRPDACRSTVRLQMEKDRKDLTIWFDVPADCRDELSQTGNPWLVLMMPLALDAGEDIELPLPVDPHLKENIQGMMRYWNSWYPQLRPVQIDAPLLPEGAQAGRRRALYFSGGVDSTFSLLRHDHSTEGCGSGPVDDLIFVGGLDIPISDADQLRLVGQRLQCTADRHGKRLLRVTTNLKELDTPYLTNWLFVYGCALGTVGNLLEGRYGEIIISSGDGYNHRLINGSHPVTDPLLGSRRLKFVHDGASFTRLEKTQQIASFGADLDSLRVCWKQKRHDNCGRCRKCLLTMVTLDLAGYRDRATCFDWTEYRADALRSVFVDDPTQAMFFEEVLAEAQARGRRDVEQVVADILRSSTLIRGTVDLVRRVPFLWKFEHQTREFLLSLQARKPRLRN